MLGFIIIGGLIWGFSLLFLLDAELGMKYAEKIGNKCVQENKKTVKRCFILGLVGAVFMFIPFLFI